MIDGSTKLVGLLGNPVAHSLSPTMHNEAFRRLRLNWVYVPMEVEPEHIGEAVSGLQALGFRGVNVTVPLKQKVIPFLDELSDEAEQIGAVNTIVFASNGKRIGHNTDWKGFAKHLEQAQFDPQGKKALVLGSGGSARAVMFALYKAGAQICVLSRNPERARPVIHELESAFPNTSICLISKDELSSIDVFNIVVNTTPVGMWPLPELSPWPDNLNLPKCELVYDLIYNPKKTKLMAKAEQEGIAAENGLNMLIYQAAYAFELWTEKTAPIEIMMEAANQC